MAASPIDLHYLDELRKIDTVVDELIDLFLAMAHDQMTAISAAIGARDLPGLAFAAHTFRDSCTAVGAIDLAHQCDEIEILARGGQLPGRRTYEDLLAGFGLVRWALLAQQGL